MGIETITVQEFEEKTSRSAVKSEEVRVLVGLSDGEAIKFSCRWVHRRGNEANCLGASAIQREAGKRGVTARVKCKGGQVYALRVRSKNIELSE